MSTTRQSARPFEQGLPHSSLDLSSRDDERHWYTSFYESRFSSATDFQHSCKAERHRVRAPPEATTRLLGGGSDFVRGACLLRLARLPPPIPPKGERLWKRQQPRSRLISPAH